MPILSRKYKQLRYKAWPGDSSDVTVDGKSTSAFEVATAVNSDEVHDWVYTIDRDG